MTHVASKRLKRNIDVGMWCAYGHTDDDYIATVGIDSDSYYLSCHHGEMPSFETRAFDTLDELENAMRRLQPDLRRWRIRT